MAEHLNWRGQKGRQFPGPVPKGEDGFSAMGKPIPLYRKTAAVAHCKEMGLKDMGRIMACVDGMSEQLSRDQPYEAIGVGMRYLDLTGTYRLMAVLLTAPKPIVEKAERS